VTETYVPDAGLSEINAATERLMTTVRGFTDDDIAAPSLLPGWTRGHVLTHIARNADGLRNLLTWAATGVETPQYASSEQRNADIEAGARRSAAEQLADLQTSAVLFAEAVYAVPANRWHVIVRWLAGNERPARAILSARLREVEIHHVDLGADYTQADWPPDFADRLLDRIVPVFAQRDMEPVTLTSTDTGRTWHIGLGGVRASGATADLAAWLIGRADGHTLSVEGGSLPKPPPWS
jgi:maleylpyruvate isomerase